MSPTISTQDLIDSIGSESSMSVNDSGQIMDTDATGVVPSIETDDFKVVPQVHDTDFIEGPDLSDSAQGLTYQHVDDPTDQPTLDVYEHQDEGLLAQLNGERTVRMMAEERAQQAEERLQQLEAELQGERERHARQLVEVVRHSFELHGGMQATTQDTSAYETPASINSRQNTATDGGPVGPLLSQASKKRGRGRPSKFSTADPEGQELGTSAAAAPDVYDLVDDEPKNQPIKKRGPGRPRKFTRKSEDQGDAESVSAEPEVQTKRGRGRPRKVATEPDEAESLTYNDTGTVEPETQPKRGRGRPKKQVKATEVAQSEHYDQDSSSSKRMKFGLPGQSTHVPAAKGPKANQATQATRRVSGAEASIVETISGVQFGTLGGIPLPESVVINLENKVAEWQSKHKDWESHCRPGSFQCVDRKASGSSGPSAWTANNTKRACCRGCFNGQSACVRWLHELDMLVVLPLPQEARVGKMPDEEDYWLYPKESASREIKVSPGLPVWE